MSNCESPCTKFMYKLLLLNILLLIFLFYKEHAVIILYKIKILLNLISSDFIFVHYLI